ncbi:MAG: hypothetical protein Q8T11_09340 [Elusimicrobiota bacterium]|nr:hypothetical protein [Elusimicrobiota bacterium]
MNRQRLLAPGARNACAALAVLGVGALLIGLKLAPQRALASLLLGNTYFLMLAVTALVFIAIQNLVAAGWPVLFRRVPEAMTAYLPAGGLGLLVILLGSHSLYHWAHHTAGVHDAILEAKAGYLNLPFWSLRALVILVLWWVFARAIVLNSRLQDIDGDVERTHRNKRLSAAFMLVFGVTFTLASIDWVMSLEPHWYSTMFPWYMFGGAFLHALAAIALATVLLNRRGFFPKFNEHHRHDLGKYVFGFGVFWAYLWFCQFLLIWYANIPEETAYYALRSSPGWLTAQALSLAANFLVPSALLLRILSKKDDRVLIAACVSVCLGRGLDLYVMIMPSVAGGSARPHWVDVPIFLGLGGVFILLFERAFSSAPAEPAKDPYLIESLHHHG